MIQILWVFPYYFGEKRIDAVYVMVENIHEGIELKTFCLLSRPLFASIVWFSVTEKYWGQISICLFTVKPVETNSQHLVPRVAKSIAMGTPQMWWQTFPNLNQMPFLMLTKFFSLMLSKLGLEKYSVCSNEVTVVELQRIVMVLSFVKMRSQYLSPAWFTSSYRK